MPKFRDWVAGRTAVTIADNDELYVRDDDANDSKRITWGNLKTALGSVAKAGDTMTGALILPANDAANQAARITAYDATTGRLAIAGVELGDTGWRALTTWDSAGTITGTALTTGAPATAVAGGIYLRRSGNMVTLAVHQFAIGAVSGGLYGATFPAGFRLRTSGTPIGVAYGTANGIGTAGQSYFAMFNASPSTLELRPLNSTIGFGRFTWMTSDAWDTTLPGTQITAPFTG